MSSGCFPPVAAAADDDVLSVLASIVPPADGVLTSKIARLVKLLAAPVKLGETRVAEDDEAVGVDEKDPAAVAAAEETDKTEDPPVLMCGGLGRSDFLPKSVLAADDCCCCCCCSCCDFRSERSWRNFMDSDRRHVENSDIYLKAHTHRPANSLSESQEKPLSTRLL